MEDITKQTEKEYQVIVRPSLARKLLRLGNQVVDIKPNKFNEKASVFVFLNNEKLKQNLEEINIK